MFARNLPLRIQAEAALERAGLRLQFAPELERRYRSETQRDRVRELRGKAILCAGLYSVITLLLNATIVIDPNWLNVSIQTTLTPLVGLLISLRAFRMSVGHEVRELGAVAACLVYALSVIFAVYFNPPQAAIYDLILVAVPVNLVLVFIHLSVRDASLFLLSTIGALCLCVIARADLAPQQQFFPVGFLLAFCGPLLLVVYNQERCARLIYVHGLLQRLRIEHLSSENESLARLSTSDPLTVAANRRKLDSEMKAFCSRPLPHAAFLLIDLDGFKAFNDRYGHLAGDRCLSEVAACMASQLRHGDLLARFGGDEFAVLMPNLRPQEAMEAAERLRAAAESCRFPIEGSLAGVTISVGVANAGNCREEILLLREADEALYTAKRAGRNRVCAAWLTRVV